MTIRNGTTRRAIELIYNKLRKDEELLRLLKYSPESAHIEFKSPLDETLPDVYDPSEESDEYWNLVNERILLQGKLNDIETYKLARIYIVAGNSRSDLRNRMLIIQDVNIHIYTHDFYEQDLRNDWIRERIEYLLLQEPMELVGRLEFDDSRPIPSPKEYTATLNVFQFHRVKGK